jgi:hypothetical protein
MSMLAERRSKVSYILNPKKTVWDAGKHGIFKALVLVTFYLLGIGELIEGLFIKQNSCKN